ncbi:hypothetical protein GCM10025868_33850 [Angustibacter aerolatus]|uniref:YbaK/aminoacyl-tRNA synthetase-associated domain-containing protein n=1 Tax=Angustibacter aerolatus TaxID=1162965 RepID=A0ABQ6JMZ6_9ACTN|nr:hypothetical protein GCM10025868_33850 [Angustibacter aerolatus]
MSAERVLKTLVADVDGTLTVAVLPVSASLDLKALAAAVGGKRAAMADPAAAERSSGYVVGGISPIGQRRPLRTVVDASVSAHETVLVSAGRRGASLEPRARRPRAPHRRRPRPRRPHLSARSARRRGARSWQRPSLGRCSSPR